MEKNFLRQLGQIKHFVIPDNITEQEYTSLGKFVHKYQSEKTPQSGANLTNFINAILLTSTMNINRNSSDRGTFSINTNELSGQAAYSHREDLQKTASDNRVGGSQSQFNNYKNTAYTTKYRPRDPRLGPSPLIIHSGKCINN